MYCRPPVSSNMITTNDTTSQHIVNNQHHNMYNFSFVFYTSSQTITPGFVTSDEIYFSSKLT